MFQKKLWIGVSMVIGFGGVGVPSCFAELPSLSEKKWLGYFIGFENKKFAYGFTVQGRSLIKVTGMKGVPLSRKLAIQVDFVVEEILPDGKTRIRLIYPESLECSQPAVNEPKNMVIRGKVKGGASVEVLVDETHGSISLGGRLVNKGTLVKNPVRFSIRMKFPNAYPSMKRDGDKERKKAFEEKIRNDRISVTWMDGKRVKQATDQAVDASSSEVNGPGISALHVEFGSYAGKKIGCVASVKSVITLSSERVGPFHDGFVVTWVSDPVKDPLGLARLNLDVK